MLVQDSSALWRARLQACSASDMTVKHWCETQGCTLSQYYYWKRRLNPATPADKKSEPQQWLAVDLDKTVPPTNPAIKLSIGRTQIEVRQGFDPNLLRDIVEAIGRTTC